MIEFDCRHCNRRIAVGPDHAGGTMKCPHCGGVVRVSASGSASDALSALADAAAVSTPPPAPHGRPRATRRGPARPQSNPAAVAALVMGVCSVALLMLTFILGCFAILLEMACAIIGAVVAMAALQNASRTHVGKGMATAGLILCLIPMVVTILLYLYARFLAAGFFVDY